MSTALQEQPKIRAIKTDRKLTSFELTVATYMGSYVNIKGDWINPPATLESVEFLMNTCIRELQKDATSGRYKYANELKIVKEPGRIMLCSWSRAEERNKFIIGYEKIV